MAGPSQVDALRETLEAGKKRLAAEAALPPAPEGGGLFGRGGTLGLGLGADPWESTINNLSRYTANLPSPVRTAGRFVIPQNAPELAVAALTAGMPLGRGALGAMKGLGGVVSRAGVKGAVGAGGAGLTAAETGHEVIPSMIAGGAGGAVGQAAGEGVGAVGQIPAVKRVVAEAGRKVQGAFRSVFNDTLVPGSESAIRSMQRIINGDLVTEVQQDIGTLIGRKYYGAAPAGFETDPAIVKLAQDAGRKGLDVWKTKGVPSMGKMWALLPAERDALAKFLAPADLVKYGQERAKLETAELAQQFFTAGRTPQATTAALFDKGEFTPTGLAELQRRYGALTAADLAKLGPGAQELGAALGQDLGTGVQAGVAAKSPKVTFSAKPLRLGLESGTLPWQPGWEKAASPAAAPATAAAKALVPSAAPKVVGAETRPTRPAAVGPPMPEPAWAKAVQPSLPPPSAPMETPTMPVSPERSSPEASAAPPLAPTEDATSRWFVPPPPARPQPPTP